MNKYNDLIGEILQAAGEKDNYKGKGAGKPLPKDYLEKDLFQNFQQKAKEAGYMPQWIKLQKEISQMVQTAQADSDIKAINKKIKEYNKVCPPVLQRGLINLKSLAQAKSIW